MSRADSALLEPPDDLTGFPAEKLDSSHALYRAVAAPHPDPVGAWWFSSDGGRFDLPRPQGTCYMATNMAAAVRERLGRVLRLASLLPATLMDGMEVVTLNLQSDARLADTGDEHAADWGAIRELGSVTGDYSRTVKWAVAFSDADFDGVLYEPRFSSLAEATAVGLFGEAGAKSWPEVGRASGQQAFVETGLDRFVTPIPSSKSAKVVAPPPPLPAGS
jgi:hypothetical protein